jgi:hypothetical protein
MILSAVSTYIFINSSSLKRLYFYHYGILDGTMLLQGVLVWLAYYFAN